MKILVLNVGSSSLKFQLIDTDQSAIEANSDRRLARGQIERIGGEAILTLQAGSAEPSHRTAHIRNHAEAVAQVIAWMADGESGVDIKSMSDIEAVGHRVVHGGERFTKSALIDTEVPRDS